MVKYLKCDGMNYQIITVVGGGMNQFKKLYVGIPVYNELPYLRKMIDSLKSQTTDDVTFLISDNNSSDGSWEFVSKCCEGDNRFVLVQHEKNIGAASNFEFLFNSSDCDYFMWMGAHDYVSPGFFQAALDVLDEHIDIVMVSGQPYQFIADAEPIFMAEAIYKFTAKRLGRYLQSVRLLGNCTIAYSVFRKKALMDFEFRKTISNDHVLLSHLLWFGNVHYLEKECYFRRYFDSERLQTQSYRITGANDYLSRHEMILYYLDDIGRLYDGDVRMLRYLEHEIIDTLQHRFGVQSLSVNDDYLSGKAEL